MHADPWTKTTVVDERRPSMAVIDVVASLEGVDPLDLDPLYDSMDPDALDSICREDGFTELAFTYCNRSITIDGTGDALEIAVEDVPAVEGATEVADTERSA
ncbi:HalOD1 output domain-containing protein [Halopiger goleimassiliensis]|uniref:HalOD1 output domain-containing protein n=1 Tax=Halopiger goleimassiliensis TaxID=1293048 RepID=UPI000677ED90|nr:HalOD1 output domain-containing protein [Halopiger goleimassiliensis]